MRSLYPQGSQQFFPSRQFSIVCKLTQYNIKFIGENIEDTLNYLITRDWPPAWCNTIYYKSLSLIHQSFFHPLATTLWLPSSNQFIQWIVNSWNPSLSNLDIKLWFFWAFLSTCFKNGSVVSLFPSAGTSPNRHNFLNVMESGLAATSDSFWDACHLVP